MPELRDEVLSRNTYFPCGKWEVSFVSSSLDVCQPADPHKTGITAASPVG